MVTDPITEPGGFSAADRWRCYRGGRTCIPVGERRRSASDIPFANGSFRLSLSLPCNSAGSVVE